MSKLPSEPSPLVPSAADHLHSVGLRRLHSPSTAAFADPAGLPLNPRALRTDPQRRRVADGVFDAAAARCAVVRPKRAGDGHLDGGGLWLRRIRGVESRWTAPSDFDRAADRRRSERRAVHRDAVGPDLVPRGPPALALGVEFGGIGGAD